VGTRQTQGKQKERNAEEKNRKKLVTYKNYWQFEIEKNNFFSLRTF